VGVVLTAYQTGKYRLDLYDTASGVLWAQGFISATAPSGEALGSDILVNGNFSTSTGWVLGGGAAIGSGVLTLPNNNSYGYKAGISVNGTLYKLTCDISTLVVGDTIYLYGSVNTKDGISFTTTGTKTGYVTITGTSMSTIKTQSNGSAIVDNYTAEPLTMPAATGALLLSSYGGSRGFVFKHASFNPNVALSYKIVKVID
jgi:hypothetical protein